MKPYRQVLHAEKLPFFSEIYKRNLRRNKTVLVSYCNSKYWSYVTTIPHVL
jgi:hypothetical protein